ncbi:MAG: hydrogenase maturation protease [Proteobacteria bacterium]|nr:hydrogenase maturation protease [Pseudomonadota bacterium]
MNGIETRRPDSDESGACCLVGYGNPQRRDDGLGWYVVSNLARRLTTGGRVRCYLRRQLEPDLLDDLSGAGTVVLVDASAETIEGGWQWNRVLPRLDQVSYLSHLMAPGYFLALYGLLHGKTPRTWQVAIQGDDFEAGEGLSPSAEERALRVIAELAKLISKED